MTNYERWRLYTSNVTSPESYVDFGFYWLIAASLQRRVWYYDGAMALYPNLYIILVGPPSLGKGLITSIVKRFLVEHKYEKMGLIKTNAGSEYPPLFPVGADTLTFEELMSDLANSIRLVPKPEGKGNYSHTSYAFCLEEMDSLFKKKVEDVCRFLKNGFDCGDYDYKTKHHGKDLLRRLCISFLAGTQLVFLKEAQKTGLFTEGFSSRSLFIFESARRHEAFHISEFTPEQAAAGKELSAWIKKLSAAFGGLTYNDEARKWLDNWYLTTHVPAEYKASERMKHYMGRKKVIMLKLAAAMHFAEELSYEIPLPTFQRALAMLDKLEPNMDAGLSMFGRNELYAARTQLLQKLRQNGGLSKKQIYLEFGRDMDLQQIEQCIKELEVGYGLRTKLENGQATYYL